MGKTLKYGAHSFPTGSGFTGSSGKVAAIKPYTRAVGKRAAPPSPGIPPMKQMRPQPALRIAPLGHSAVHRAKPITQEDALHGGKSPLLPGFKKGGQVGKC